MAICTARKFTERRAVPLPDPQTSGRGAHACPFAPTSKRFFIPCRVLGKLWLTGKQTPKAGGPLNLRCLRLRATGFRELGQPCCSVALDGTQKLVKGDHFLGCHHCGNPTRENQTGRLWASRHPFGKWEAHTWNRNRLCECARVRPAGHTSGKGSHPNG